MLNDAIKTFMVFAGIGIAVALIIEGARLVLEAVRLHRVQVNKDLQAQNATLRAENGRLRDKAFSADCERRVHNKTTELLGQRIAQLSKENKELKEGTPVCTGFVFMK